MTPLQDLPWGVGWSASRLNVFVKTRSGRAILLAVGEVGSTGVRETPEAVAQLAAAAPELLSAAKAALALLAHDLAVKAPGEDELLETTVEALRRATDRTARISSLTIDQVPA